MKEWFEIDNIEEIDSPALLVYSERVEQNVDLLIESVEGDLTRLCPHVKTSKISEICSILLRKGIFQFKCSTLAEAEMLALIKAPFVLLAYQPVGPKQKRWIELIERYPETSFACLVDNIEVLESLNALALNNFLTIYIDVNVGMGRTGLTSLETFYAKLKKCTHLKLEGLHGYDGHINNSDIKIRKQEADISYAILKEKKDFLQKDYPYDLKLIIGGSPSFSIHHLRKDVICSPGTFVFWDWGYSEKIPDQKFDWAALVITRVISVIDENHVCVDLGYKSVACENPLPRVLFLNAPDSQQISQSEEHLVLRVENSENYPPGKVLYAVPRHICPTVAMHEKVNVIEKNHFLKTWEVVARNRKINI